MTISLCMIVKNEEAVLARCLDGISPAVDEIIIVDTGSTDETKAIAQKYTKHIYDFEWINDFAAARNFAFSKATMDYQMWLDADDVIPAESLAKLLALKNSLSPNIDIATMNYITHFDKDGLPILSATRERLLKTSNKYQWLDPVHEYIPLSGNIYYSDIDIHHKKPDITGTSHRNLDIYTKLEQKGIAFNPRQTYYYARELKDHKQWAKAAYYFERFLNSGLGWVEDNIAACHALSICYDMLKDDGKIMPTLLKSLEYDSPRAEICCDIGYFYKKRQNYDKALRWFALAASLDAPKSNGFILWDYWGYIPNIEACVCACHLQDFDSAAAYNEKAATFKPNAKAVEINRAYLKTRA